MLIFQKKKLNNNLINSANFHLEMRLEIFHNIESRKVYCRCILKITFEIFIDFLNIFFRDIRRNINAWFCNLFYLKYYIDIQVLLKGF